MSPLDESKVPAGIAIAYTATDFIDKEIKAVTKEKSTNFIEMEYNRKIILSIDRLRTVIKRENL